MISFTYKRDVRITAEYEYILRTVSEVPEVTSTVVGSYDLTQS